jgi:hypothetical protein
MKTGEWRTTRKDLYEQLWSKPLKVLEKELGIWYGQLLQLSEEYEIPRPPMGHWVKVQHGKPIQQVPLKPLPGKEEIVLKLYVADERPYDEEQRRQAESLITEEALPEKQVTVTGELLDPHPYVARAERSLRNAPENERQLLYPNAQKCLDIRVSGSTLPRALRIMDALLKALEARNISVELTGETELPTRVTVLGETFGIGLEEKVHRREKELTPAQKREKERDSWRYDRTEYTYHPSGQLVLCIKRDAGSYGRQNWSDGKIQRVELMLNKFICALFRSAVSGRSNKLQRAIDEAERLERQRKNEEIRQLQQRERARLELLEKHTDAWKRSQVIREYIEAVRERAQEEAFMYGDQPVFEWIEWALEQADRLDPLRTSPYSVLDEQVFSWW